MKALILSLLFSLSFLAISVVAMRRQRLREQAALLWLLVSFVMVFVSVTLPFHLLDRVSHLVGIAYPPDLALLLAVLFLTILVFHLSLSLARLSAKQTALVQEIGLMSALTPMPGVVEDRADQPNPAPGDGPGAEDR